MTASTRMAVKTTDFVVHMGVRQRMAWRRPFLMLCYMRFLPRASSQLILMLDQSTPCLLDTQITQMATQESRRLYEKRDAKAREQGELLLKEEQDHKLSQIIKKTSKEVKSHKEIEVMEHAARETLELDYSLEEGGVIAGRF